MSETTELPVNDLPTDAPAPEPVAVATPAPPVKEGPTWQDKMIASQRKLREAAETDARTLREENTRLRAAVPAGATDPNDPVEIERRADERASERYRVNAESKTYNDAIDGMVGKLKSEFGDDGFNKAAQAWTSVGLDQAKSEHRQLLTLLSEVDAGPKLFHTLAANPDLAHDILNMTPLRAAFELAKHLPAAQAKELIAEAKEVVAETVATQPVAEPAERAPAAAPKPVISSAPRPSAPAPASRGSSSTSRDISDPKMSMDDYARVRAEQRKTK